MRFATDKIGHGYLPTYLRIAAELGASARVCEVGVYAGNGLHMFQALFPAGLVAGVDCDAGSQWPPGTVPVISAQDSPELPGLLRQHSAAWDLIVDDASHDGKLTAATFGLLWPLVAPGGFYVIEDWAVGLGWEGFDDSMLVTAQGLLPLLTKGSDTEDITYRYGLAVVRKKGGMTALALDAWQDWFCPNCDVTDRTRPLPPNASRFHTCAGLHMLTAPLVRAGTSCKVEAEVRGDYLNGEVQATGDDGRPYMAVRTTRGDGEDLAVNAGLAQARLGDF